MKNAAYRVAKLSWRRKHTIIMTKQQLTIMLRMQNTCAPVTIVIGENTVTIVNIYDDHSG